MARRRSPRVDLHTHTTASDGSLAPPALVDLAVQRQLAAIAITDHDSTEGIAPALAAAQGKGLLVLPGIELGADLPGGEVHILGYLLDVEDAELQRTLRTMRQVRVSRARAMLQRLAALGLPLSWPEVAELAGAGAVGRAHVALAMLRRGYVASTSEAFERYIGLAGPAYVERYHLTPVEAVALIMRAGGVAALAHPVGKPDVSSAGAALRPLLRQLKQAGLVGIEVYYHGYSASTVRTLLALARSFDLVPTGGSDFHGRITPTAGDLGSVRVPLPCLERLLARHRRQQTGS